jgi:hypothetical protein
MQVGLDLVVKGISFNIVLAIDLNYPLHALLQYPGLDEKTVVKNVTGYINDMISRFMNVV